MKSIIRKPALIIALVLVTALASLGGSCKQHPSDVAAQYIIPGTEAYFGAQEVLIRLKPLFTNEQWQKVSDLRHAASAKYHIAWDAWYKLSLVNSPENVAELNQSLAALGDLVIELLKFVPETEPQKPSLMKGASEMAGRSNGGN